MDIYLLWRNVNPNGPIIPIMNNFTKYGHLWKRSTHYGHYYSKWVYYSLWKHFTHYGLFLAIMDNFMKYIVEAFY